MISIVGIKSTGSSDYFHHFISLDHPELKIYLRDNKKDGGLTSSYNMEILAKRQSFKISKVLVEDEVKRDDKKYLKFVHDNLNALKLEIEEDGETKKFIILFQDVEILDIWHDELKVFAV